jgi:hypothetical protein
MNRRKFLQYTSAGFGVTFISPGFSLISRKGEKLKGKKPVQVEFIPYRKDQTLCPVQVISHTDGPYMHTFYDVQPFSPCNRYLVLTRLPYQFKAPLFGDTADVCVLDLHLRTLRTIYSTKAWGTQVGANVQWGNDSRFVYTNDWIGNQYVCVRIDLETEEIHAFSGPMYHISPDANYVAGFSLDYINLTQMGYGAPENPESMPELYKGAPDRFGLIQTNLKTNECKVVMGLSRFKPYYGNKLAEGTFYLFHTKYNAHSNRIMQVVRCMVAGSKAWNPSLFTFDINGNELKQAITMEQWGQGGNHPNWHPDGQRIIMNLRSKEAFGSEKMLMVIFNQDGSEMKALSMRNGSGHPSVTPDTRYLLTDAYAHPREKEFINNDGEVKIRLIDLRSDEEEAICYVYVPPVPVYGSQRIDPHPVWSRDYKKVIFAGAPQGKRETFMADLSNTI